MLDGLENPSDYLTSHVIARLINALEAGQELSIETCLEDAAEHGHPSLTEEPLNNWRPSSTSQRPGIDPMRSSRS